LLPFVIAGVVILHIWALHVPGNNNPLGIDVKSSADTVAFHPYYTVKDGAAIALFLLVYFYFVFFNPTVLGHSDNSIPADPLVTPSHIVPEWYYLPFYAILRSVPDKLLGVILMFGSIFVLFLLPWLDTSRVRSAAFRPMFRQFFWIFVVACLLLGYVGALTPDAVTFLGIDAVTLGRILTIYYFAFFLLIIPVLGMIETPKQLPRSISEAVLAHGGGATPAAAGAHAAENRG
jgi:ubiquinol-cytochrome c reductase cytochrome b/c1 subunit